MPQFVLPSRKHDAWNRMWQAAGFSGLLNRLDSWLGNSNKSRYKNFHKTYLFSATWCTLFIYFWPLKLVSIQEISLCLNFHENSTVHYIKYYSRSSNEGVRSRGEIHFPTDRISYYWYTCIQLNTLRVQKNNKVEIVECKSVLLMDPRD